ncbi:MAG TPA: hypothetical protein PKV48_05300 [Thermodesulfobacteriota bacterium]|nr:hypothetical protein [Thermodesulfobacteriota bacterium]
MEMNIKNQLMTWARTHNLNWLIGFHNYVRGLFRDQLQELEKCEIKDVDYKLHKNALCDYDRIHNINILLMMYSYLEEWLYHCWKTYASNADLVDREGSLGRFKNVAKQLGVDLSSKLWQELKNTEELRNCLLHANGRVSLLKDPQKINTIIERKKSGLEIVQDRIQISGEYLECFNKNISELMDIINKSAETQGFIRGSCDSSK